jgi:hypothetical protein
MADATQPITELLAHARRGDGDATHRSSRCSADCCIAAALMASAGGTPSPRRW